MKPISKLLITGALLLILSACNSMRISEESTSISASQRTADSAENAQLECRREKVMGSNLTQRVCYPKDSGTEDSNPKTQIAKVDENEDQIVCKKEKVMGSNLRKRVCYRKKDRDARNKSDQDDYRELSTRSVRPGASTLD